MILDANLILAENQAVTATAISQNVILLPTAGTVPLEAAVISRNLGPGNPLPLLIQVTETFATLTSLTITLETSAAAALTSSTVLATSGAVAAATLVAGFQLPAMRFFPNATLLDYVGMRFTVGGSNATAGKVSAAIATWAQTA